MLQNCASRSAQTQDRTMSDVLDKMKAVLGPDGLGCDGQTLQRYARSVSPDPKIPMAVAWPTDVQQVRQLVLLAHEYKLALYPISCGKNWGYGDACAPTDGQVIVDLSHMNKIIEVNDDLCYCVIEPGVTQKQLYDYLCEHHPNLQMDVTGAGLSASIVGNTLDRGFGHTRYGDHFLTCSGMQVVLADGHVLETGFGHYPNAKAQRIYRYGNGPFLDGIFAQSNLGIVTQIGLWLMPKPEAFCAFFFYADTDEQLPGMIDALAPLRMQGLLQSTIHIGNDLRVVSARMRYPFDRAEGVTPLPDELRKQLRKEFGIGAWNGGGAIYGPAGSVRAIKKKLRKALKGYHLRFLDDRLLGLAETTHRVISKFGLGQSMGELLEVLRPVYGLLKGVPSDEPMRGAGWRVRDPMPAQPTDPLDTNAGLMWASPVLPNKGDMAKQLLELVEPIYQKYGFEALVTFTMITERAMIAVTNLAYDKRETEEASRAEACYDELMDKLIESGFIPYRAGHHCYSKLHQASPKFWDVASQIKNALDPQQIFGPGRYLPDAHVS